MSLRIALLAKNSLFCSCQGRQGSACEDTRGGRRGAADVSPMPCTVCGGKGGNAQHVSSHPTIPNYMETLSKVFTVAQSQQPCSAAFHWGSI